MSFLAAASAARTGQNNFRRKSASAAIILTLGLLFISCNSTSTSHSSTPNHVAYATLPASGSIVLLQINGATGSITPENQTPQTENTSPSGLALYSSKSKKFLYAANSRANTISIFTVNGDSTLTLTGTPTPAGGGPDAAIIDPTNSYLLVTNNFGINSDGGDVSVYSINSSTGALTEVAGSPFPANNNPTDIHFTHSGQFVYVTNPAIGMVTGFSFANGVLTQVPGSPFVCARQGGADALAIDASDRFLYVTNPTALNPPSFVTVGNISAFNINSSSGTLTPVPGSPFSSADGSGASAVVIDPTNSFVYAVTAGTTFSIWCFSIDANNGQLTEVSGSAFNLAAGGLFAIFDPGGNYLYIGGQSGVNGYTYNQTTGQPTQISGSPFATGVPGKMVFSE